MIGQEKIAKLILDKGQDLILSLVPAITQMAADKIGIKNIGQPDMIVPDTCLPSNEIQKLVTLRNNLYNKLINTSKIIENLSKNVDILNKVVNTTSDTLNIVLNTKKGISSGVAASNPAVPGAPIAAKWNLDALEEYLKPKINITKITITSVSFALDFVNEIINNLLALLKPIDIYLTKCGGGAPPALNNYLLKVEQTYNQIPTEETQTTNIYQGFILEIVEEPYSPTVNRRKAVAKNNNGIILLQTPLSFTTTSQVLIEELKLIIDSNDLKAY